MSDVIKFVNQLVDETSPPEDAPRVEMQSGGVPLPEAKRLEILARFPEADFSLGKFGFLKGDPRYDLARNIVRREQRSAKAKTPESKARRRELQNLAYKDPERRKRIRERQRKYFGRPEVQERRSKQQKKMYYEGGKREKDLKRLRGIEIDRGYGAALKNPDNNLIKDMIRAERQGKADLKLIRGGNNNVVVAVQEGKKVYAVVGSNRKPLPVAPKNAIPITKHPQFKKRAELTNKLKAFKNTKVPNQDITYGQALDRIEAERMGARPMNRSAAEYEHTKGVKEDYKKGQIATRSANVEKKKILTALDTGNITRAEADRQLKKLGVRGFVKGKYIGAPKINPDKQINDLKKYVNRKIALSSGSREFLRATPAGEVARDVAKKIAKSSGPTLGINLGFGPLLKTAGEVLGSPAAALAFATMTVKDNLEKGESLPAAVADKMVGLELLAPGAISRFAPGVMKGVLGLGRAARVFTPVGLGLTAAGMAKDVYREYKRREALSDEDRLKEDLEAQEKFDEMMVGAAKGGLIPPKSGKTPHGDKGLASLADYDMTNTEFINGRY